MSKMSLEVKKDNKRKKFIVQRPVTNFMGGVSFEINPLETLKMITASSIFGEPSYYRDGEFSKKTSNKPVQDGEFSVDKLVEKYSVLEDRFKGKNTSEVMETLIDESLDYDYKATLEWALELRQEFGMRLNPQVIMVRACMHEDRAEFNENNPGLFRKINSMVMSRMDEPSSQLTYYLYRTGDKKGIPTILKTSWKNKYESANRYQLAKYKNSQLGIINTVRICHANSPLINELMKTGKLPFEDSNETWEVLKSRGLSWKEIVERIEIPHFALLRNLRGIFSEIDDLELAKNLCEVLVKGVAAGKLEPFRYNQAYKAVSNESDVNHKTTILDALENCIDEAINNMAKLKGKTAVLSDNSGSAWDTFPSEYGSATVAEIGNLSGVMTAMNSEEGHFFKFGDKLIEYPISKRNGALKQASEISREGDSDVGGDTENGIWLFFDKAIKERIVWDNIFIYSDQQAGHGGLYGLNSEDYREFLTGRYNIDVMMMLDKYRREVNPKVNLFTIQTAGYSNVLIPEYTYRGNVLYGWTGKELKFASEMIKLWDSIEQSKK